MPEIVADLGKEKTGILFSIIVHELKNHGLYTDDVLPEYVILLIANRHPQDKIVADLEGLLNPDFARAFTTFIFQEINRLKTAQADASAETHLQSVVVPCTEPSNEPGKPRKASGGMPQNRLFSTAIKGVSERPSASAMAIDTEYQKPPASLPRAMAVDLEPVTKPARGSRRDKMMSDGDSMRNRRNRSRSPNGSNERTSRRTFTNRAADINGESERVVHRVVVGGRVNVDFTDARELLTSSGRRTRGVEKDAIRREVVNERITMEVSKGFVEKQSTSAPPARCTYWPNCTAGEACKFFHPSETCKFFPNCTFGERCLFIHPSVPCKFQQMCQNSACNFTHLTPAKGVVLPPSTVVCRYYPNCMNPSCPFVHPIDVPCKFGDQCQRPGCHFTHPATHSLTPKSRVNVPCHFGKNCAKPDCPYQHQHKVEQQPEATQQPQDMVVEPISGTIEPVNSTS